MKQVLFFLCLIGFITSCEEQRYCAQCLEVNTGYYADEYCGTSIAVDAYIEELESYDPLYPDQDWTCDKLID